MSTQEQKNNKRDVSTPHLSQNIVCACLPSISLISILPMLATRSPTHKDKVRSRNTGHNIPSCLFVLPPTKVRSHNCRLIAYLPVFNAPWSNMSSSPTYVASMCMCVCGQNANQTNRQSTQQRRNTLWAQRHCSTIEFFLVHLLNIGEEMEGQGECVRLFACVCLHACLGGFFLGDSAFPYQRTYANTFMVHLALCSKKKSSLQTNSRKVCGLGAPEAKRNRRR